MRELPLAAEHRSAGARFTEAAGWQVPLAYGDADAEQRAVRTAAGVVDWSPRGKIRVAGPEALPFLDNLLTNDLSTLRDGRGLHAALLERKGHVIGDLAVHRRRDDFLIETEPEVAGRVFEALAKLLVGDDATLDDATSAFTILGLFGPRSGGIVRRALGTMPPTEPYAHGLARAADIDLLVARAPDLGGEGYELWIPAGEGVVRVWRLVVDAGAAPFGFTAAEALRIEAGRPKAGVDMDETTLALEARLETAISMTKGCYLGQEVVARIVHQGHVNRLLVGLDVDGETPPRSGAAVLADGTAVGHVTSAARSASLDRVIALGYVGRGKAAPGTNVLVDGDPPVAARVATRPFLP